MRSLEEKKSKLATLRAHLSTGASQSERGEFVDDYSIEGVIAELDVEMDCRVKPGNDKNGQ